MQIVRPHKPYQVGGEINVLMAMAVIMTIISIVLGAVSIYYIGQYSQTKATANQQKTDAIAQAKTEQKQADDAALTQTQPYRTYQAPSVFGGFSVSFPKNWNLYAAIDESATTQLNLFWNPDLVQADQTYDGSYALRVTLTRQLYTSVVSSFQSALSSGVVAAEPITVKGINGTRYEGQITINATGVMVVLPIRDKTFAIWTESADYLSQFDTILSKLAIVP